MSRPIFVPSTRAPRTNRVECRVCGREGEHTHGKGWQASCLRGHAPCPKCGHLNPVKLNGTARACTAQGAVLRHTRLPTE